MRIHWFAFTIFASRQEFDAFYREFLAETFGDYIEKGHGGRGYKSIATAGAGIRLYFDPISTSEKGNHVHVEIPGEACECLIPDIFGDMVNYMQFGRRKRGELQPDMFAIKRLDFAFDHEIFTPEQWYEAIIREDIVTLAKRELIEKRQSPFALRDNGEVSTTTVYLGSNESERMVRVYNKRGPTRLEFQMRDDRSHLVALDVLLRHPSKWHEAAMAHIVQYVTFKEGFAPDWWVEFIGSIQAADLIISSSQVVSFEKLDKWMKKQVAVALSVMYELEGGEYFRELIKEAKRRDRSRYEALLQLAEGK